LATRYIADKYELATEVLACRRIVKGYSDTHAGGLSKFDRILTIVPAVARMRDAAGSLRRLRLAALAEESGESFNTALRDIEQANAAL
jgi:indolepyruvate ferredoxin oxidoreductase beta subunit